LLKDMRKLREVISKLLRKIKIMLELWWI